MRKLLLLLILCLFVFAFTACGGDEYYEDDDDYRKEERDDRDYNDDDDDIDIRTSDRDSNIGNDGDAYDAEEYRNMISGSEWHYGSARPLDCFYTFYENGTWQMYGEGGADEFGTYEIDGNNLYLDYGDYIRELTIISSEKLIDKEGGELVPYVKSDYDSDYDQDDDFDDENTGTDDSGDSDTGLWGNSDYRPEDIIGRWYEDGYTNGYCLEMYSNGTWQYFGEEDSSGYFEVNNSIINLTESSNDIFIGTAMAYDDDGNTVLSVSIYEAAYFRTRSEGASARFRKEENSWYCDDLDSVYGERYPFTWLSGVWYPYGDDSGWHYYIIGGEGNWSEWYGEGSDEIGSLEESGDGIYISYGVNYGGMRTFQPVDDYLYIDDVLYERR